jgi:CubicO group peptidase (beta-lactamase class C family)
MTVNHTRDLLIAVTGCGFGLGFAVCKDIGEFASLGSEGNYAWGGAFGTLFWVDPKEEMIGIFMTQLQPHGYLGLQERFWVLAYQAIIDQGMKASE